MGMMGQLVLPCCWPQQPPPKQEWIGRQYPMTVDELALVERGIRLARFVDDAECRDKCQFGPYDHTVGWTYKTKVCLKDLGRLGLWKPSAEEQPKPAGNRYRVLHRPSNEWWEGEADSIGKALGAAGFNSVKSRGPAEWRAEDCWVRQMLEKGWGNPPDLESYMQSSGLHHLRLVTLREGRVWEGWARSLKDALTRANMTADECRVTERKRKGWGKPEL